MMKEFARKLRLMIGRCVIRAATADGGRILVSIDALHGEQASDVEMAEPFGYTAVPLPGGEGIALSFMGSRDRQVVVPLGDRSERPKDLAAGERAMFGPLGHRIIIRNNGIEIISPDELRISAPSASINGRPIATVGDLVQVNSGSSAGTHAIITGIGS